MKKKKSVKRRATIKSAKAAAVRKTSASAKKKSPKFGTVTMYLVCTPEPARSALNQMRAAIREVVPPGSTEVISYNIPAFKGKKILIWYAAFAGHCSLFPGAAVIEQFKDELKGYTTRKGTVQFPIDRALPLELIKRLTRARLEQAL